VEEKMTEKKALDGSSGDELRKGYEAITPPPAPSTSGRMPASSEQGAPTQHPEQQPQQGPAPEEK
jgi:hypothetical protein